MSSIDKRIVQMQFDNQGFERGVSTTMKSLDKLNESLKMKNATTGLTDVQSGINKLTSLGMGALSSGVDAVSTKFNALNVIAATALMNITNRAIEAGRNLSRKLTVEPITTGFSEYETKMGAIQTILTNTASKGTTMDDVTAALNELNTYADKTIYSFSEMTKNIGTFTAAGVDLEDSVQAIKGIANLGAGSGSDPTQVATGMYQLSQALAAGKVGLQDWNSVVNAGMGGELFKNELIKMAKSMGIYVDQSKPFRETLKDDWLTSEVLLKTLQKFAEDESLVKAATEVKTLTGLIGTMQESVQSGWATSWEHIFGNKEQAAELFTSISDGFNKMIQPSTDARNAMLKFWNEHSGRTAVIEGLTNVMQSFQKVMRGISMAWEMVFPPMTGQRLVDLSNKFKDLTEKFKITDQTAGKIGAVFKGFLDTAVMVKDGVVSLFKGITPLKDAFKGMGTGILDASAKFGKFLSGLRESAANVNIFEVITTKVSEASKGLANFILGLRSNVASLLDQIAEMDFTPFFDRITGVFQAVKNFLKPIIDSIAETIDKVNLDTFLDLLKGGLLVQVVSMLKGVFDEITGIGESANGFIETLSEIGSDISDALNSVKDALSAYQKDLNANTLMKMAGAIAILAGALLLISSIDGDKLAVGLTGMTVAMAELVGAFLLMDKLDVMGGGGMKISAFFLSFSTSVLILAAAIEKLGNLDPKQLMTGILGLTVVMGLAVASAKLLGKNSSKLSSTATGLVIFGAAMMVMSEALERLGSMDPEVIGSGLVTLGMLLAELAIFMRVCKFDKLGITSATGILIMSAALLVLQEAVDRFGSMNPDNIIVGLAGIAGILAEIALFSKFGGGGFNLIAVGVGLTVISNALETLSGVMNSFGGMSWEQIGIGLTAMAGGLLVLGVASKLMSGLDLAVVGLGIGVMSASLLLLSAALNSMGNMTWEEIGKGLLVLAASLTILAVAMYAMSGALLGAAAMVIVAGALAILTPQLLMLSQMSLEGIGIALLAMAGAFTVLGLACLLLTPVVPTLLALSGVIVLIGIGAVACGAGLTMIGAGLAAIGVAVGGSGFLIVEFLKQLINLLPQLGTKLGEMVINMAKALGDGLAEITKAIETVLMALLTAIQNVIPKVIEVAVDIVVALAEGLAQGVPAVVTAAMELIKGVLQGIAANIEDIVVAGMDCVIGFMDGIASRIGDVIQSGIELALSFIEGVADGLTNNKERMAEAVRKVIKAMLTTGVEVIKGGLTGFLEGGKELLGGLVNGIKAKWPAVKEAVSSAIDKAKGALANAGSKLVQAGKDLIQGFINGIASKAYAVASKAKEIASNAVTAVTNFLGINSPSRVFMEIGKYTAQGMAIGLDKYAYLAEDSASGLAENVVKNVKNPLSNIAKLVDGDIDVNPTITPVMDLTNVEQGARRLSDMIGNQDVRINARTGMLAGSVGKIQNGKDNSDVISAIKDLKEGLSNNTSYNINGITYDDGSNITNAVETLVRAARIERRI